MTNLGNISGRVYATWPPCWDEVWVCHHCKTQKTVTKDAELPPEPPDVSDYRMSDEESDDQQAKAKARRQGGE